ncbi:MAG: type VI secretion system contractile sheath protein TssC [Muribaculaceae bacterium]|nr:type VI secretion system contractile sheath protein TssC [Muribaculaceae bacterium]
MAAEEMQKQTQSEAGELRERVKIENPAGLLQESLAGLNKQGGFQLVKGLIKGVENMDPRRKAQKNIFLNEAPYADARRKLRNELEMWVKILEEGGSDPQQIIESCTRDRAKAEENMKNNLFNLHEEVKQLEITYRSLDSFFANAGQGKVECLTLMNVSKDDLADHDSDDTKAIRDELERYYDRLSLKNNYSLMVMPGYLGDASTLRMWGQSAYRNKVIMVTDFRDSLNFEMLKEELDDANLQSQDAYMANVVMTCNYLLGRKRSEIADEDDDLYVPGSAALAGRMTNTDDIVIAQGAAGKKYGTLDNVKGARMNLRKSEIAALIDLGVIPMVEEEGRTMAFSNRSLYNGATMGLQEYPIVRVFDWIGKVFQNFFNDEAFTNWNSQVKAELTEAVHDFLSDYKGPGKLIENYNLKGINQDPKTKDINIQVELKPFFAAKNFLIELTGHNGTAGAEWDQNVS